jgi:hypothetical protein
MCWASSPGRFQALWELEHELNPRLTEKLNRYLTHALGADKGGWDLTQVLRVPGTRNFKYPDSPPVKVIFMDGPTWKAKDMLRQLRRVLPEYQEPRAGAEGGLAGVAKREDIPPKLKRLLLSSPEEVVEGERSARIWEIECGLAECGWDEAEIFDAVWPCAWNKWSGINTGASALHREIRKAMSHVARQRARTGATESRANGTDSSNTESTSRQPDQQHDEQQDTPTLAPVSYATFMSQPRTAPKWLVEEIWTAESHGIIGGEPKTSKSTIALALGLSIASGRPFLGQYGVGVSGPVMMIQEENSDWTMEDRLARIAASYGLIKPEQVHKTKGLSGSVGKSILQIDFPVDLPFYMVNHSGFDLSDEDCRRGLEEDIKRIRPVAVIFDPLYLIMGGADENRSVDLRPYLQYLLRLRYDYKLAPIVVHHNRKAWNNGTGNVRAGQRLLGSTTLHGWVESALYCEAMNSDKLGELRVKVEREFRNVGPRPDLEIALTMGEPGDLKFEARVERWTIEGAIEMEVAQENGIHLKKLVDTTGFDRRTVLKRVRGSEDLVLESVGRTHRVWLADSEDGRRVLGNEVEGD